MSQATSLMKHSIDLMTRRIASVFLLIIFLARFYNSPKIAMVASQVIENILSSTWFVLTGDLWRKPSQWRVCWAAWIVVRQLSRSRDRDLECWKASSCSASVYIALSLHDLGLSRSLAPSTCRRPHFILPSFYHAYLKRWNLTNFEASSFSYSSYSGVLCQVTTQIYKTVYGLDVEVPCVDARMS